MKYRGFNPICVSISTKLSLLFLIFGWNQVFGQFEIETTISRPSHSYRDGAIDTNFSPILSLDASSSTRQIVTLSDGKIVAVGNFKVVNGLLRTCIARINVDGTTDASFNVDVQTTNTQTPTASINSIAVLPEGKLLIGGWFTSINGFATRNIARLNSDGTTDTSFVSGTGFDNVVSVLSIQSDAKIYVGGDFSSYSGVTRRYLARLNENGTLDTGFNNTISSGWAGAMHSIRPLPDGKVFIQGKFNMVNSTLRRGLAKLNSDGSLDTSFVEPGPYSVMNLMQDFVIRPDGKLLIGGFFEVRVNNITLCKDVCLLNSDGTADPTFFVQLGTNASAYNLLLQPNGKLIVSGSFASVNGVPRNGFVRLNPDASIDSSFNSNLGVSGSITRLYPSDVGRIALTGQFSSIESNPIANFAFIDSDGNYIPGFQPTFSALSSFVSTTASQNDGDVIVAGRFDRANGTRRFGIARLKPDGNTDTTFDSTIGQINTSTTPGIVEVIAIQSDGRILVGGDFYFINGVSRRFLARLNSDGSLDSSFLPNLNYQSSGPGSINAIAIQPDGKIVIGGRITSADGIARQGYARLNSNGSLDSSFIVSLDTSYSPYVLAIALQADGKVVFGGDFRLIGSTTVLSVIRVLSTGDLDSSFAQPTDVTRVPYLVKSLRLLGDGRILVGGSYTGAPGPRPLLSRLMSDGTSDISFLQPSIGFGISYEEVSSVSVAQNKEIVIGGRFSRISGTTRYNLARLTENGHLDYSLDTASVRAEATGSSAPGYESVVQLPSGNLIVSGLFDRHGTNFKSGVAKLLIRNESIFDFDGDGRTDLGVFRPNSASGSEWWLQRSTNGSVFATQFGSPTDRVAAADYTGDGKTDVAFWRPATGFWYVLRSEDQTFYAFPFGANGDVPVPADYDADGKADVGVFRPTDNTWYIQRSSDNGTTIQQFGTAGDVPVNADYDGDGKADIAIYRLSAGQWWLSRSTAGNIAYQFGSPTDKTVVGDYTGDGKADVAFWRPSTGEWFILRSEDSSFFGFPFGTTGDTPVPGDYDGDGRNDAGVFRSSNSTWYINRSTAGTLIQQFGTTGDVPLPNAYVR